jgi:hypothetical protein
VLRARCAKDHKKGADTGIDGYINFFDPSAFARGGERKSNRGKSGKAKQVIVQVKSGYVGVNHVRDLKGVIEREKAAIGALITLREPTKPMRTEAAAAGGHHPLVLSSKRRGIGENSPPGSGGVGGGWRACKS